MASLEDIKSAARAGAERGLTPTEVVDVSIQQAIGSDGEAILQVTIVVPDDQFERIDGTHFLSALLNVKQQIADAGDDRLTVVYYSTQSELAEHAEPED